MSRIHVLWSSFHVDTCQMPLPKSNRPVKAPTRSKMLWCGSDPPPELGALVRRSLWLMSNTQTGRMDEFCRCHVETCWDWSHIIFCFRMMEDPFKSKRWKVHGSAVSPAHSPICLLRFLHLQHTAYTDWRFSFWRAVPSVHCLFAFVDFYDGHLLNPIDVCCIFELFSFSMCLLAEHLAPFCKWARREESTKFQLGFSWACKALDSASPICIYSIHRLRFFFSKWSRRVQRR